jgi:hypothetical protein
VGVSSWFLFGAVALRYQFLYVSFSTYECYGGHAGCLDVLNNISCTVMSCHINWWYHCSSPKTPKQVNKHDCLDSGKGRPIENMSPQRKSILSMFLTPLRLQHQVLSFAPGQRRAAFVKSVSEWCIDCDQDLDTTGHSGDHTQ